ncbi:MAG: hypothetical protein GY869_15735, partial [Planctomycetes bacterium]|nr:hypothetical protein [Planctomycetota bacterium]
MEQWVQRFNGPGNDEDIGLALDVDDQGSVYVTGYITRWFFIRDYVTIKYDTNGNQIWRRNYSFGYNLAKDIVVDAGRNTYVTGESFIDFDWSDYLTIKYDPNGATLWTARYDHFFSDQAQAIALGPDGSVHVTGNSDGQDDDYATIKYSPTGNQNWVARYDHTDSRDDFAVDIAVDAWGNVYVTGYSQSNSSREDFATIKYDSNGQQQWIRRFNGTDNGRDYAEAVGVDSLGFVYVSGTSNSTTNADYTTIKYAPDGAEQWIEYFDNGGADHVNDMVVAENGDVYVVGYSRGSGTDDDYAVVVYDSDGNEQ